LILLLIDVLGTDTDDPELRDEILKHLERYRRIGHLLQVRPAEYVPVELTMRITLAPHHQWGAVRRAVRDRFSNAIRPDGGFGFFHPDQVTFGQGIPVSTIVAAALEIPGVAHVRVTRLQRRGFGDPTMPVNDLLEMEPWQIARLDNDPERPENGVLTIEREPAP
jgi:hypothetical protein